MSDRIALFEKYKRLKQYKNKTDKEIYALVDKKLGNTNLDIDLSDLFTDKKELKKANILLEKYLEEKDFDNTAEKQNLKNVIWLEMELEKAQQVCNNLHTQAENFVPEEQLKSIISMMKQVSDLKKELGFYQKEKEESDGYKIVQRMLDRAKLWREKNQGTRHILCPICQNMLMLKIRTDEWEVQKHPYFEDHRVLTNKHLIKLYCEDKISKEDISNILEVSEEYIEWLLDKWKNHPDYKEFIKNKDKS